MTDDDSGSDVVLVVEDEPLIRMMAVDFSDEALIILDEHPEINVLFTDIDMPGLLDGISLAEAFLARRPDLPVILASGYLRADAVLKKARAFSRNRICKGK